VAVVTVLLIGGIILSVRPPWRSRDVVAAHSVKHKADPKAEQLYLAGIYHWHKRTPESLNQAVDSFTQAIVVDPDYAPAYVGLADCYNLLREYSSMPPEEAYPRAISAARRAIILDDSLAGAHSSLAFAEFYWSWQIADAEKEFRRAIELSPNSVQAHHWYATSLLELARFPEAVEEINRAQTLDPQSTAILADKGLILYYAGKKEEGISLLKSLEVSDPTFLSTHGYLAGIALIEGDHALYLSEARKTAEARHDADAMTVVEASEHGFAHGGSRAMFAEMIAAQKKLHASGKTSAYALAETSGLRGDDRGAMEYLNESYAKHESALVGMRISPFFGGLHKDPQFQEMIKKVGLPPL
jgi:tetratricopeptide (TPR) repeat protein